MDETALVGSGRWVVLATKDVSLAINRLKDWSRGKAPNDYDPDGLVFEMDLNAVLQAAGRDHGRR